ncbi:hypothetical protein XalbCFBP2523_01365 [Xanthomonas albilineans]|nr:hypothetical protein XalbCFBP2523_01365 [Xanthomonas albilineans]
MKLWSPQSGRIIFYCQLSCIYFEKAKKLQGIQTRMHQYRTYQCENKYRAKQHFDYFSQPERPSVNAMIPLYDYRKV